jgi:hypothetical protein
MCFFVSEISDNQQELVLASPEERVKFPGVVTLPHIKVAIGEIIKQTFSHSFLAADIAQQTFIEREYLSVFL